jgi:D-alanyl-D-alanine dipeptidase
MKLQVAFFAFLLGSCFTLEAQQGKSSNTLFDTSAWIELQTIEPGILIDLKYATTDNFVHEKLYDCPRCFLRADVAYALREVHRELKRKGLGLKMFDCYRPLSIQWKLWNKVPDPRYVADPRKGSMHNRGSAVDLTLVDANGKELDMGTKFDFFGEEAYHDYTEHPREVLERRTLLKEIMAKHGFKAIRTEWWHYSYARRNYPVSKMDWPCGDGQQ